MNKHMSGNACDAFNAITTDRPYRRRLPLEVTIEELRRGAGGQFDPAVVEALGAATAAMADAGRDALRATARARTVHVTKSEICHLTR
jgi:HD-GYP domain-containing protein (c-di-GMP phosphodiesterase class II)